MSDAKVKRYRKWIKKDLQLTEYERSLLLKLCDAAEK